MTRTLPDPPLIVSDQTVPTTLWTIIRYAITAIGGLAVGRNWISDQNLQDILGVAGMVIPNLIGAYLSHRNKVRLITAARSAHNDVAVVK